MADIACDLCEQEPAVLIQTNLGNGDTVGVGGACLLTFALAMANELAGQAGADTRKAVAPLITAIVNATGWGPPPLEPNEAPKRAPRKPRATAPAKAGG